MKPFNLKAAKAGKPVCTKDEAIWRAKEEVTNGQREKSEYVDTVKICWEE